MARLYRLKQLLEMLNVSKSSIYLWMEKDEFPRPKKLSIGTVAWSEEDINEWLEKCKNNKEESKEVA